MVDLVPLRLDRCLVRACCAGEVEFCHRDLPITTRSL
jgi:hypothetical protein